MSSQGALGHGRDVPGLLEDDARLRLALAERRVEVLETALRAREAELELAALPQTAAPEAPGEVERLRARLRLAESQLAARAAEEQAARRLAERSDARAAKLAAELRSHEARIETLSDQVRQSLDVMDALETDRAEHERRHREAAEREAAARTGGEALRRRADELTGEIDGLRRELGEATREQEALRAALDRTEARAAQGAEHQARAQALEAELEKAQRRLEDAERAARDAAHAAQADASGEYRRRVRELEQTVSTLIVGLRETKADIERAEQSRAWRLGHGVTRAARRLAMRQIRTKGALVAAVRRLERLEEQAQLVPPAPTPGALPPTDRSALPVPEIDDATRAARRAELAAEVRARLGPAPAIEAPPKVSIIVLTRDGVQHLRRLVAGLVQSTDYPSFELVVVDNASSDGTHEFLNELEVPFPVVVCRNERNESFSDGNNQGVEAATGELLLFANNDVAPFEPGWLREMVGLLRSHSGGAVGATLLRLEEAWGHGPTMQHRGVRFRSQDGLVRAFNDGDGELLFTERFGRDECAPAMTAACLLVSAETFDRVGGFSDGYRYGTEDVDLGLKLLATGREVWCSGRAILFHEESVTQNAQGRDFQRLNRLGNRKLLLERWGPQLRREHRLALLRGDEEWTGGHRPHIAVTVTSNDINDGWGDWYTAHEMGDALEDDGWRVTYIERKGDRWYSLPGDVDYVLSLMDPFDLRKVPSHVVTIAWIRNWTDRWLERPWFDRIDVLLTSSQGSAELVEERTGRPSIRFPLATNPDRFAPMPSRPEYEADYVFTGNYWGQPRDVQPGLPPRDGQRLRIFGRDWDQVAELAAYAHGAVAYHELPAVYSSAKLVIDDTAGPTLPYGAVNCRVFDALACGRLPITNCAAGVRELFDEDFPTWESPGGLRAQLDALLADDERRRTLAERYRSIVLERHTYAHRARRLREVLLEAEQPLSYCIKIGAPSWDVAERWGDLHFARAMERELRRRGHRCLIQVLNEWEELDGLEFDVVVHLRGLSRHFPKPGQFNVLWCISHPEQLTGEECDGYDLVAIASAPFAEEMRERTRTPVIVLEQATDPRVFYPDPDPKLRHELVYVANSRNVLRPIMRDLLPTDHDLAIYGGDWDGLIDTSLVVAEHVPNDELRKVYSSASIVLNDHWDDMRERGFISNRIYDALACGAVVVSDDVAGLDAFEGSVVVYRDATDLRAVLDRLLSDPEALQTRSQAAAALVRDAHTFADRVDVLEREVQRCQSNAGVPLRVTPVRAAV